MKKILYILEFIVLFVLISPYFLNFTAPRSNSPTITLPSHDQIKSSISLQYKDASNNTTTLVCAGPQSKTVGFPFVYKTSDNCSHGTSYDFSRWLDYVAVALVALIITKLTSMVVRGVTGGDKDIFK